MKQLVHPELAVRGLLLLPPSRWHVPLFLQVLLGAFVAVVIYRSGRQDVTMDEAVTVSHWVLRDGYQWTPDTNNHMLNTLLMKMSTSVFGISPLSIRLPAIFGAIGYGLAGLMLTLVLFGTTWRAAVAFVILAFNPFVMDYFCVARGYSIALAGQMVTLFLIASDLMTRAQDPFLDEARLKRHFLAASLASGVATFANFVFIVPQVFALALYFLVTLYRDPGRSKRKLFRRAAWLATPFLAILTFWCGDAIMNFPYQSLDWNEAGASIFGTFHSMAMLTFQEPNQELLPPHVFRIAAVLSAFSSYIYPVIAVICALSVRPWSARRGHFTFLVFAAALLIGLVVFYIYAHAVIQLPFPFTRTALPLVAPIAVSFSLLCLGGWHLTQSPLSRLIGIIGAWMLAFTFIAALHFDYVSEWKFNADIGQAIKIAGEYARSNKVREVATDSESIAAGGFYREYYGYDFDLQSHETMRDGFVIYLISPGVQASQEFFQANKHNLKVLFESPINHLMVAVTLRR